MSSKNEIRTFLRYVIPSVLSFALSGVYSIVDGYFVGNSLGDMGLSAINIAYPIVAVIQSIGTGIGMGGAIHYSISKAEGKEKQSWHYIAGSMHLMLIAGILMTVIFTIFASPVLRALGADGQLLSYAEEYIVIIALGSILQVAGTGFVPFIRNHGGSVYAMMSMIAGFITNIILDYIFVWIFSLGMAGAAWATIIGQGVTMLIALVYLIRSRIITFSLSGASFGSVFISIIRTGIAPFGLAMSPNIALVIINRFSMSYGGEPAVAVYACIAYVICIVYLIFQSIGDGSQPLLSEYYGKAEYGSLFYTRRIGYIFSVILAIAGCGILYAMKDYLGLLFGSSPEVNEEAARIIPIFLLSVPFVAISRITTAGFYAMDKSILSYIVTFAEPVLMLVIFLVLPQLFGGQMMIWWETVAARILTALIALSLKRYEDRKIDVGTVPYIS